MLIFLELLSQMEEERKHLRVRTDLLLDQMRGEVALLSEESRNLSQALSADCVTAVTLLSSQKV